MNRTNRNAFFIAILGFCFALIGHSPWSGYDRYISQIEPAECGIAGWTNCTRVKRIPKEFSEWVTNGPLIEWLGNVSNFIALSILISSLLCVWLYLSKNRIERLHNK
jgi:hypothetical protein